MPRSPLLRAAVVIILLAVGLGALWRLVNSRTIQLFGEIVPRVQADEKVVALTFDDGPTPAGADSILRMLEALDVRATFFVNGRELRAHPELGRRFVAAGHQLGNHTWSHGMMLLRSPAFIRREVEGTDEQIRRAGQLGDIPFRAPYGKKLVGLPWYLSRTGRVHVTFDVEPESFDEVNGDAGRMAEHVLERTQPGSIILLHVMYRSRAESRRAVPAIVGGLRARGYRFVTVSELMAMRGRR